MAYSLPSLSLRPTLDRQRKPETLAAADPVLDSLRARINRLALPRWLSSEVIPGVNAWAMIAAPKGRSTAAQRFIAGRICLGPLCCCSVLQKAEGARTSMVMAPSMMHPCLKAGAKSSVSGPYLFASKRSPLNCIGTKTNRLRSPHRVSTARQEPRPPDLTTWI
jgi:hypothetical protein